VGEGGQVSHPGESAVRLVQQRPELLGSPPVAARTALAVLLRRLGGGRPPRERRMSLLGGRWLVLGLAAAEGWVAAMGGRKKKH
jgi:hypothetical protein